MSTGDLPPDDDELDEGEDSGDEAGIPAELVEAYEAVEFGMAVDRAALEAEGGPSTLTGDGAPRPDEES